MPVSGTSNATPGHRRTMAPVATALIVRVNDQEPPKASVAAELAVTSSGQGQARLAPAQVHT